MEIEYYCKKCEQVICTCNIVCPNCGNLLSSVGQQVKMSLTTEVDKHGKINQHLDKSEHKIVKEVWNFLTKGKKNESFLHSITSGTPLNICINFNFFIKKDKK